MHCLLQFFFFFSIHSGRFGEARRLGREAVLHVQRAHEYCGQEKQVSGERG